MLSVDGPVKQRLETLAGELAKAADKELQVCWRRGCGRDLKNDFFFFVFTFAHAAVFWTAADWWHLNSSLKACVFMCAAQVSRLQKNCRI